MIDVQRTTIATTTMQLATEKYYQYKYGEALELFASVNYMEPYCVASDYPNLVKQVLALLHAAKAYSKLYLPQNDCGIDQKIADLSGELALLPSYPSGVNPNILPSVLGEILNAKMKLISNQAISNKSMHEHCALLLATHQTVFGHLLLLSQAPKEAALEPFQSAVIHAKNFPSSDIYARQHAYHLDNLCKFYTKFGLHEDQQIPLLKQALFHLQSINDKNSFDYFLIAELYNKLGNLSEKEETSENYCAKAAVTLIECDDLDISGFNRIFQYFDNALKFEKENEPAKRSLCVTIAERLRSKEIAQRFFKIYLLDDEPSYKYLVYLLHTLANFALNNDQVKESIADPSSLFYRAISLLQLHKDSLDNADFNELFVLCRMLVNVKKDGYDFEAVFLESIQIVCASGLYTDLQKANAVASYDALIIECYKSMLISYDRTIQNRFVSSTTWVSIFEVVKKVCSLLKKTDNNAEKIKNFFRECYSSIKNQNPSLLSDEVVYHYFVDPVDYMIRVNNQLERPKKIPHLPKPTSNASLIRHPTIMELYEFIRELMLIFNVEFTQIAWCSNGIADEYFNQNVSGQVADVNLVHAAYYYEQAANELLQLTYLDDNNQKQLTAYYNRAARCYAVLNQPHELYRLFNSFLTHAIQHNFKEVYIFGLFSYLKTIANQGDTIRHLQTLLVKTLAPIKLSNEKEHSYLFLFSTLLRDLELEQAKELCLHVAAGINKRKGVTSYSFEQEFYAMLSCFQHHYVQALLNDTPELAVNIANYEIPVREIINSILASINGQEEKQEEGPAFSDTWNGDLESLLADLNSIQLGGVITNSLPAPSHTDNPNAANKKMRAQVSRDEIGDASQDQKSITTASPNIESITFFEPGVNEKKRKVLAEQRSSATSPTQSIPTLARSLMGGLLESNSQTTIRTVKKFSSKQNGPR